VEDPNVKVGQIVKSIQGRDKGRNFVVIGEFDHEHILIADGKLRKVSKPKKKKLKHIAKYNVISEEIQESIITGRRLSNAFIKKELERLGMKQ
jgi:ribosomal protein L14E/L6E/L27E